MSVITKIMAEEKDECEKLSMARMADTIMMNLNSKLIAVQAMGRVQYEKQHKIINVNIYRSTNTAPNLNMASAVNIPAPLTLTGNIAALWKTFKQNFEIYMTASGNYTNTDNIKIAMLLNIMGQEGAELYNILDLTSDDRQKYEEVIQALEEDTTPNKN
ncbi:hypothetical protein PR048_012896 [Dryococelus australis]|uniref:Uncharacterized protein n=1 Tax=Dryococelus australis TaxID=614101 RepID=A0ABQ9HQN9_9NEOP|nr:hypothetical protein PR048_012896 [Dryococelus australis]